jgi:hypothetical protein
MRAGNLMGVAFPLFTQPMYARLGIHWASTLFGCIAVAMVPIPYVSPVYLAFLASPSIVRRFGFFASVLRVRAFAVTFACLMLYNSSTVC